jgi:hypothetical protein
MNVIKMMSGGRFVSHHGTACDVYFDSRHKIIKSRMEDGAYGELVLAMNSEGKFHAQLLSVCDPDGTRTVLEYGG